MRIDCKKCKRDLTKEMIKMLEGKIERVICPCKDEELRDKIAKDFNLFDTKQEYLTEFDNFLNKLIERNGTTNY